MIWPHVINICELDGYFYSNPECVETILRLLIQNCWSIHFYITLPLVRKLYILLINLLLEIQLNNSVHFSFLDFCVVCSLSYLCRNQHIFSFTYIYCYDITEQFGVYGMFQRNPAECCGIRDFNMRSRDFSWCHQPLSLIHI